MFHQDNYVSKGFVIIRLIIILGLLVMFGCGEDGSNDPNGSDNGPPLSQRDIDNDGDGVTENQGDCDDSDISIGPDAMEVCGDDIDQDCNGSDLDCPVDPNDVDNDGDGYTENQGDCDDGNDGINPEATEVCGDGIDQDCSGSDLDCPVDPNDVDNDGDGYTENQGDCDDGNDGINPGATEVCGDGIDQDCSGSDLDCPVDPNDVDNDGDGYTENQGDCDDGNDGINPGATEVCGDGIDQDCSGSDLDCPVDPNDVDNDGDGYTENQGDCDDGDENEYPNQTWYKDGDGDGYSDGTADTASCTRPAGYKTASELTATSGDCDDDNGNVSPSATENCGDGIDNDCDGDTDQIDSDCAIVCTDADTDGYFAESGCGTAVDCDDGDAIEHPGQTWYKDQDRDDYSDGTTDTTSCTRPTRYNIASELTATSGDCDDDDSGSNPGASEVCSDGIDNDCDGDTDQNDSDCPIVCTDADTDGYFAESGCGTAVDCDDGDAIEHPGQTWYKDQDRDDYSDGTTDTASCSRPFRYNIASELTATSGDCDDDNDTVFPAATENCGDGLDNDCDGDTDLDDSDCSVVCTDADSDGYFAESGCGTAVDCDDNYAIEHPDQTWYKDQDRDDYSDGTTNTTSCTRPFRYNIASELTATSGDCDDDDEDIHPGASEVCSDALDNDCDGNTDLDDSDCSTGCTDGDNDGYFAEGGCGTAVDCNDGDGDINPGATEVCGDGIDNDCVGGDESCGGSNTIAFEGSGSPCPLGETCDLDVNTKITVVSNKSPTWKLDFGVGEGDDAPIIVGGGVAHNLRIPATASNSLDEYGNDSCLKGLGLDNHEWRWRVPSAPEECDGVPASEPNVLGKGTRGDIGMLTISSSYSLIEETPTRIVFTIAGRVRTRLNDTVKECAVLGLDHTFETTDYFRTTTITPDGYRVELEVDYNNATVDQDSMWWTIAQFKNAEGSDPFSQGILPSQVTVTNGSKTLPLEYTPHSGRLLGWSCDIGMPGCSSEYPNGTINVPYTIIYPLNSPVNHDITFRVNTYAANPYGGTPNYYEFWHEEGQNPASCIDNYSVVYPRWSGGSSGFKDTTYVFDWTWRFTP